MKKALLTLLVVTVSALSAFAKSSDNDPVLMTINKKPVKLSEFEYLYQKNNAQQLQTQPLDEYVDLFVIYKLKVADAEAAVRFVKGAPEIVLDMCSSIAGGKDRAEVEETLKGYQSKAMRTLGFAYQSEDSSQGEMVFLGVAGIADPVRRSPVCVDSLY